MITTVKPAWSFKEHFLKGKKPKSILITKLVTDKKVVVMNVKPIWNIYVRCCGYH